MELEALTEAVAAKFIEVEASGRHVHVTKEQAKVLFGGLLTPSKPLSQPGQYAAEQRVRVIGPKGSFDRVAVLGPERGSAQVEISLSDARTLGIQAPIRQSGDTKGSPGCALETDLGRVELSEGVIVAKRHIHLRPQDAAAFGVTDGQEVKLQCFGERGCIFPHTVVRVNSSFAPRVHLDYDEANACGFRKGDLGRILP